MKAAVLTVFKERVAHRSSSATIVGAFEEGAVVHAGEDVTSADVRRRCCRAASRRCGEPVADLTGGDESPAAVAVAVEFILEGLHLSKRLNKDAVGARATYRRPRLTSTVGPSA